MNLRTHHIALIAFVGIAAPLVGWATYRSRQNTLANKILNTLAPKLDPSTFGIDQQPALRADYIESVKSSVTGTIILLNPSEVTSIANKLNSYLKPWYFGGDDEEGIYQLFSALKDKVQVAQIAQEYQKTFGEALPEKLSDHLNETELSKVLSIIDQKPPYRTR